MWFLHFCTCIPERVLQLISFSVLFCSEHWTCLCSFQTQLTREKESQRWYLDRFSLVAYLCLKQVLSIWGFFWSPVWRSIKVKINTFFHPVNVSLIRATGFLDLFRPGKEGHLATFGLFWPVGAVSSATSVGDPEIRPSTPQWKGRKLGHAECFLHARNCFKLFHFNVNVNPLRKTRLWTSFC